MHSPHFAKDLMSVHVWRQTQTQSTTINFFEEDMYIFNPRRNDRGSTDGIFRMEFPLMQWMNACLFKLFGNHVYLTRIFMFLIGLLSCFGLRYFLIALFKNSLLANIGFWAFSFSPCFFYYTINPLPDNLALCLGIWGLAFFFKHLDRGKVGMFSASLVLLAFASLCKLPFIIYFIIPGIHLFRQIILKGKISDNLTKAVFFVTNVSLALSWYVWVIPTWKENPVVSGMFGNSESISQLVDIYVHTFVSTLPELLLNYGSVPFFLAGIYFLIKRKSYQDSRFILLAFLGMGLLLYFFFEANAIGKAHDYYLFPFYPALFILVAYGANHLLNLKSILSRYTVFLLLASLPLFCFLRMGMRWDPNMPGFNKDLLQYKSELRAAVPDDALVIAGNDPSHFIFFYYINKKGWGINDMDLKDLDFQDLIDQGAEYLYTDSKALLNDEKSKEFLDSLLVKKGSIHVYSLKQSAKN